MQPIDLHDRAAECHAKDAKGAGSSLASLFGQGVEFVDPGCEGEEREEEDGGWGAQNNGGYQGLQLRVLVWARLEEDRRGDREEGVHSEARNRQSLRVRLLVRR